MNTFFIRVIARAVRFGVSQNFAGFSIARQLVGGFTKDAFVKVVFKTIRNGQLDAGFRRSGYVEVQVVHVGARGAGLGISVSFAILSCNFFTCKVFQQEAIRTSNASFGLIVGFTGSHLFFVC